MAKIRTRIEEGLAKLKEVDYDKGRLEQEMIFYIEKLDINEEKQRLTQHLNYFIETMNDAHGQGKKLGFISQEMGREINTLGSKSNHAEMQKIVVRMKDELEQTSTASKMALNQELLKKLNEVGIKTSAATEAFKEYQNALDSLSLDAQKEAAEKLNIKYGNEEIQKHIEDFLAGNE